MSQRHKSSGSQDRKQRDAQEDLNQALREDMVLDLRMKGYEFRDIALMVGYSPNGHGGAAVKAYHRALSRIPEPKASEERKLDALRINALFKVYMPKALDGDGWSHDRVLHLLERRAKLLGLDIQKDEALANIPYSKTIILTHRTVTPEPPPALPAPKGAA